MICLTKKKYKCNSCANENTVLLAIKRNIDIASEFPKERIEDIDNITKFTVYTYEVVRDDFGITLYKEARKAPCSKCQSKDIVWIPGDNEENVLNFYGESESGKWFKGFQDLSR